MLSVTVVEDISCNQVCVSHVEFVRGEGGDSRTVRGEEGVKGMTHDSRCAICIETSRLRRVLSTKIAEFLLKVWIGRCVSNVNGM